LWRLCGDLNFIANGGYKMKKFSFAILGLVLAALIASCNPLPKGGGETKGGSSLGKSGSQASPTMPKERPQIGKPLPTFVFQKLDGGTEDLARFIGKPLMVNFWATWCPPCRMEIPDFVKFYEENRHKGLQIVSLGVSSDTLEAEKKFLETQEMPWVLGMDTNDVARFWGITGIPTTYFVNSKGIVVDIQVGAMDESILQQKASLLFK